VRYGVDTLEGATLDCVFYPRKKLVEKIRNAIQTRPFIRKNRKVTIRRPLLRLLEAFNPGKEKFNLNIYLKVVIAFIV